MLKLIIIYKQTKNSRNVARHNANASHPSTWEAETGDLRPAWSMTAKTIEQDPILGKKLFVYAAV